MLPKNPKYVVLLIVLGIFTMLGALALLDPKGPFSEARRVEYQQAREAQRRQDAIDKARAVEFERNLPCMVALRIQADRLDDYETSPTTRRFAALNAAVIDANQKCR